MNKEGIKKIRVRIMSEAYDLADRGDSEGYNAIKVMCSDVLAMIKAAVQDENVALHDKVNLLRDELGDMHRCSLSQMAVMQQALEALEGVVKAHSYESGTPVEAIVELRRRLGIIV